MPTTIFTLPDFTDRFHIPDVYGASVACVDFHQELMSQTAGLSVMPNFYSLVLMIYGDADFDIGGRKIHLEMHDLMVMPPHMTVMCQGSSTRAAAAILLVEAAYFDEMLRLDDDLRSTIPFEIFSTLPLFHLDESKASELYDHFEQIRKTIKQPRIYKGEMVKYQVHIMQLFLAEQLYGDTVGTHDLKHKENIFKIFIYLAAQNFRKERQIKFYADKLNITTAYLSRTVRTVSGNTVYGYLSNFLYNEACRLLKTTSMTIGEIAEELSFNDQSAFTNYFKQRSGMSPLAYRSGDR